ncbi:MAG TPA: hypothetical protein PLP25_02360 [Candidatus Limiplasma sp.]|nr:hypothetical protein [Candidatus Limiplasma sp.]HPS80689.1 hypothetical protein [Candidatus Limiplasma sp.]
MKKAFALFLALTLSLSVGMLSATAEQGTGLKFGLYINTTMAQSSDASDTDGNAQVDSDAVAVLVDAQGKIVDLDIDSMQTKMPFTAAGKLGNNFPTEMKTKRELGDSYGMAAVSKLGDWDKQIEAFRVYVIGKTADEVNGIAVDESTRPTGADLTAGCTMAVGSYISGVSAAIGAASPAEASATDKVGVGITTSTDSSIDAADGQDGLCEAYSYYAAVAVNADGVVTACQIDSTKGAVTFDATGKITSDLSARVTTIKELGDAYGMKSASSIGKEWYEQANAFAAYVVGKTAADIQGIAVDESTKPTGADLTASVTLPVGPFQATVLKAIANAR